ncbi:retrovirus-related Pol polyprotein from transposon 297 [Nephila pilipes]|uniref:Retrovirus-related Pol polyprotein from transposon 297 n=1 Tax=Nephila pilipes TaxID=299642 RepID=A0A8X6QUX6_NEPPI|nr:retrovirus-related Pol polyprotein from transposon 297 [Nephila pilipes]
MKVLPPVDQKDVSVANQPTGTPITKNIVGTTGVSNNMLQSAQSPVPSRRKTRAAFTRFTGWWHKEDSIAAFEKCKKYLAEETVLYHPAANALLDIIVDALDTAVGAALHQQEPKGWQTLTFFSKAVSPAQRKYSAYDGELLAAYKGIKYFRHMVEGLNFILFMDHKPLIYAFKQKEDICSPRQLQQLDLTDQFPNDIQYLKGLENVVANALLHIHISTIITPGAVDFKKMAEEQQDSQ